MFRDTHHGKPCKYCPRLMSSREPRLHPTRDHHNPRSKGGGIIVVACATCNTIKADLTPKQWEAFMAKNPCWWLMSRKEVRDAKRKLLGLPPRRPRGGRKAAPIQPYNTLALTKLIATQMNRIGHGHREEGNTDRVAAVVETPAQVEEGFLEERTSRLSQGA